MQRLLVSTFLSRCGRGQRLINVRPGQKFLTGSSIRVARVPQVSVREWTSEAKRKAIATSEEEEQSECDVWSKWYLGGDMSYLPDNLRYEKYLP